MMFSVPLPAGFVVESTGNIFWRWKMPRSLAQFQIAAKLRPIKVSNSELDGHWFVLEWFLHYNISTFFYILWIFFRFQLEIVAHI